VPPASRIIAEYQIAHFNMRARVFWNPDYSHLRRYCHGHDRGEKQENKAGQETVARIEDFDGFPGSAQLARKDGSWGTIRAVRDPHHALRKTNRLIAARTARGRRIPPQRPAR
jgi:hypothetical protein